MNFSKNPAYIQLSEHNVADYAGVSGFFAANETLAAKELSDGNINFVFRVSSMQSGKSVIVKQATSWLRSNTDMLLTDDRVGNEVRSLRLMDEIVSGSVPKIYYYDSVMKCCIMEDCKDYKVMRSQLMCFKTYTFFAEFIAKFMAKLHFYTSDFSLDGITKKQRVCEYTNPELSKITERLVYTEPFTNYLNRNTVPEKLLGYVQKEFYEDDSLHAAVATRKYEFLTCMQAIIHGDLHTGSVLINENGCKVFDSEFASYGPCGFDIGCIVGNLIFSYLHARVVGGQTEFGDWVLGCASDILKLYQDEFLELTKDKNKDLMLKSNSFARRFVKEVIVSSVAVAGIELLRRTIGKAKVAEITELPTEEMKIVAMRGALVVGKQLVMNPVQYSEGLSELTGLLD